VNSASITAVKGDMAWLNNKRGLLVRYGEIIALILLIVIVSVINMVWIRQDTRPQPAGDPSAYLLRTYEFVDNLKEQGGAQLWQSIAAMSLTGRPPLYQLLSVPFIFLFGRSADAALFVNILFGAILLLSTYGIGRLTGSGKAGLLAAFLVATYPPIVGLSRMYAPWFGAPACVALSLWLFLLLLKTRSVKIAWLFGASLGFGMLIRHYHFFLLPSTVVFGLYMVLFPTNPRHPTSLKETPRWLLAKLRDPFVLYGLLPAALIAAGLTAAWYLPQSQAILTLQQRISAYQIGVVAYGFPDVRPSFWWYALTAPRAISTVLAFLLAIGLVIGTIKRPLGPAVLVVTFLLMYGGLWLSTSLHWVHFALVLPIAAVLTAIWVVDIRDLIFPTRADLSRIVRVAEVDQHQGQITVTEVDGRALRLRLPVNTVLWDAIERGTSLHITPGVGAAGQPTYRVRLAPQRRIRWLLSTVLIVVCVGVATFNFAVVTWGAGPWSRPIAVALGAPLNSRTCLGPLSRTNVAFCPNPARDEDWRASDILRVIVDDPQCQERRCHLVVVPRLNTFERNVFAYYLVRDFPQSRQRVRVSRADWHRGGTPYNARWLTSDYLVYIPQLVTTKAEILLALTPFLESPPAVFADAHQEVASFALPGGWTAKLIKRTAPLTLEEARLSIAALDIPEEGKSIMLRKVPAWLKERGELD
jgi:hypothetical protein